MLQFGIGLIAGIAIGIIGAIIWAFAAAQLDKGEKIIIRENDGKEVGAAGQRKGYPGSILERWNS